MPCSFKLYSISHVVFLAVCSAVSKIVYFCSVLYIDGKETDQIHFSHEFPSDMNKYYGAHLVTNKDFFCRGLLMDGVGCEY